MNYFTLMLVNTAYQSKIKFWSGYAPCQPNSAVLLQKWKKGI